MAVTVLLVQGAGDLHDPEGSIVLARMLEHGLPAGYRVHAPAMPGSDDPRFEPWRDAIEQELEVIEPPLVIVGHSFGGTVVLRMLAEGSAAPALRGLFLVAMPWWGPDGWEYEPFAVGDDVAERLPAIPIFLYHSVDDPHVPFAHLGMYAARLPAATVRAIEGSEHAFRNGLPELLADIRKVADGEG